MKKLLCIAALTLLMLLCSCESKPEPIPEHKAGVLYFTDETKTYSGCATRAQEVITALTEKANLLITKNNTAIESQVQEKFFLEPDYILTSFKPFASDYFVNTFDFSDKYSVISEMTSAFGEGSSSFFEKVDKNSYSLTVQGEQQDFELRGEYSRKHNSLCFSRGVFGEDGISVAEFLDFVYIKDKGYFLQSAAERCVIAFDESGNIIYFTYASLKDSEFEFETQSIYPNGESVSDIAPAEWTSGGDKSQYTCIYTYADGALSYEDCSSGKWKTVNISESSD